MSVFRFHSFIGLGCLLGLLWNYKVLFPSQHEPIFHLVLLPRETGAVCLDGTQGGYYWTRGTGSNASRWIIHLEGGGWCVDLKDCAKRAKTDIGSSKTWVATMSGLPEMDGGAHGILSSVPDKNPDFYTWSKVHINYCDGGSFSGDLTEPVSVGSFGEMLYFRGRRILDAALDSLSDLGLSSASHLIIKGCSAGGLATYLHSDYIRQRLPSGIDVVALADAGLFLDSLDWNGSPRYTPVYQHVAEMQNASALNQACLQAQPADQKWRCFLAENALPRMTTPVFITQALYDSWQVGNILGLNCAGDACPLQKQRDAFFNFAVHMKKALATAPNGTGIFATSCHIHGQANLDYYWDELAVRNVSMKDAFAKWWRTRKDVQLIDEVAFGERTC